MRPISFQGNTQLVDIFMDEGRFRYILRIFWRGFGELIQFLDGFFVCD